MLIRHFGHQTFHRIIKKKMRFLKITCWCPLDHEWTGRRTLALNIPQSDLRHLLFSLQRLIAEDLVGMKLL